MKEITVQYTPATIVANIKEIAADVTASLEKYKGIVVTVDTAPDAKKQLAEINKSKASISSVRIATTKKHASGLDDFIGAMKELESLHDEPAEQIKTQVERFEDERRELVKTILQNCLDDFRDELDVLPEFRAETITDLVKLTAITPADRPTAASKSAIESRARGELEWQREIDTRLMSLELESHRAGVVPPLTRAHVESFLYCADDDYARHLNGVIQAEKARQTEIEAAAIQKRNAEIEAQQAAEKAAEEKLIAEQAEAEPEADAPVVQPYMNPAVVELARAPVTQDWADLDDEEDEFHIPLPTAARTKSNRPVVTCSFMPDIDASLYTDSEIQDSLIAALERAGFKSILEISVNRNPQQEARRA